MYSELGRTINKELRIKFFVKVITIAFMLLSSFLVYKMNEKQLNEFFQMANINELVQIEDTKKSEQSNEDMIDRILIKSTGKSFDDILEDITQ